MMEERGAAGRLHRQIGMTLQGSDAVVMELNLVGAEEELLRRAAGTDVEKLLGRR